MCIPTYILVRKALCIILVYYVQHVLCVSKFVSRARFRRAEEKK